MLYKKFLQKKKYSEYIDLGILLYRVKNVTVADAGTITYVL